MSNASSVQLLVLERRETAANLPRFYVLSLEETLFGDTALVREWGRLGTKGRRRLDLFEGPSHASEALEIWLTRKCQGIFIASRPPLTVARAGRRSSSGAPPPLC